MRTALVLVVIGLFITAGFASAAIVTSEPVCHDTQYVFQAYPGSSGYEVEAQGSTPSDGEKVYVDQAFLGYKGLDGDVIGSVPGVLAFYPGKDWCNFVKAAQDRVKYTIKNVLLVKKDPRVNQAADVFLPKKFEQQGTEDIRTWWPLMYSPPETKWELTILYGTPKKYQDSPNNPATYVHTEVWKWEVDADLCSLSNLLELFHELPFGLDEVPLVSDEYLYYYLQYLLDVAAYELYVDEDAADAGEALAEFEMVVADTTICESPEEPYPWGDGTGIAQTEENPAAAKLMVDAEFIGYKLGIFQPGK